MPFKSVSQRNLLFAKHPEVAKEFASHMTHKEEMALPEHVTHKAGGGYSCMACGGEVGEDGHSVYEEPSEENEMPMEGEQEEHDGEMQARAAHAFVKAVGR